MELMNDDEDEYASSGSLEDDLNGWNYRKDQNVVLYLFFFFIDI